MRVQWGKVKISGKSQPHWKWRLAGTSARYVWFGEALFGRNGSSIRARLWHQYSLLLLFGFLFFLLMFLLFLLFLSLFSSLSQRWWYNDKSRNDFCQFETNIIALPEWCDVAASYASESVLAETTNATATVATAAVSIMTKKKNRLFEQQSRRGRL